MSFELRAWLLENEDVTIDLASSSMDSLGLSEIGKIESNFDLGYEENLEKELQKEIRKRIYKNNAEVLTSPGTQPGNFLIMKTLLENGDEVIVEEPCYLPLQNIPKLLGCDVKILDRKYQDGFGIDAESIKKMTTEETKLLAITNPHNPSGLFLDPSDLREVQMFLEERNIPILVDEIYRDFIENSESLVSMGKNMIVTSSLSKVYGMGGSRVGWISSTNEDLIKDIKNLKLQMNLLNSNFSNKVGLFALNERERLLEKAQKLAKKNLSMVEGWIEGNSSVEWVKPSPGIISFPKLNIDFNSKEFAEDAKDNGVLVAPGQFFSSKDRFNNHIRLTFGTDTKNLAMALQRLSMVIDKWR